MSASINFNRKPHPLQDIPKIVDTAREIRQQNIEAFPVCLTWESP
jgi:hypothetical protein